MRKFAILILAMAALLVQVGVAVAGTEVGHG